MREGRPHLVTVIGQAGVGKSRLLRELERAARRARPEPPAFREGRCPAYGAGIVYWALGEVIRGEFGIVDTDDSEAGLGEAAARDRGRCVSDAETDEPPERIAAAIGRLLGIEPPPSDAIHRRHERRTRSRCASASSRRSAR